MHRRNKILPALLLFLASYLYCVPANCENIYQAVLNEDYFPALVKLITGAKRSIRLVGLSFDSVKNPGKKIVSLLIEAAARGVDVNIFLEGDHGFAAKKNRATLAGFWATGVKARADSKSRITHCKLLIVDDNYVLLGSTNLTRNSMIFNNEANFLIKSADAGFFFRKFFNSIWNHPYKQPALKLASRDNESIFFSGLKFFVYTSNVIDRATAEINLMMYMIKKDDGLLVHKLLDKLIAAHRRGVKVKLFLEQSGPKAFNAHIHRFNNEAVDYLKKAGITDIVFDSPKQLTHSKILIADNKAVLIGSNNWFEKGIISHRQIGVLTTNHGAVSAMKLYFERLFNQYKKK
ncbi:phosphatidylserine/phosphatidylglycerophosphate/cardiolipin synthase family protein [Candidatus Riflebacteria bacterium]